MPLDVGQLVGGRYRLEAPIARGGMGVVYRAVDERLARGVALKVMHAELAGEQTEVTRFTREAAAMASLHHLGLVQVLDAGEDGGVPYLVMELVHGRTLAQVLDAGGKLDPMRAADITEQALFAISVAHGAGIVHRDLKPGNLMVVDAGGRELVKVLDFGIAQLKTGTAYTRLTQTGAIVGTPTFMAPEQVRGEVCDARTDVYAMGVVLWCCLTGRRPFVGTDIADTILKVMNEPAIRADRLEAGVPPALATTIEIAMSKRREDRFASASAFASALADLRSASARPLATALMSSPSLAPPPPSVISAPSVISRPASSPSISPRAILAGVGLLATVLLTLGCLLSALLYRAYRPAPIAADPGGSPSDGNAGGIFGSGGSGAAADACQRAAQCCATLITGMSPTTDTSSCSQIAGLARYGPSAQRSCEQTYASYAEVAEQHGLHCE